jgi:REP element-mobilizing transposase RayT
MDAEARMSRRSRLHVPGGIYYVVQRSNARQPVLIEEADYAIFEKLLSRMLVRCRARAHAFCWETDFSSSSRIAHAQALRENGVKFVPRSK